MAGTLGTISGQVRIDTAQAVAAYAALRAANIATLLALRSASAVFIAAGTAVGGLGLAITAGFAVAIKAAADFERQLDFFGAVSNTTEADMEAVRTKALQLGKDTRYSAGQIADSFVELGKAGVSAADIVGGVGEAVANLGAAADIPLDMAANIITSALQTFKLGADQAVRVADLLAGAANASIVEVDDLGVSLKYVGGVAASVSIPIEDTITAISLLGKAGIRGSTAGTSLRQIIVSLTGTSKKASKTLKELGIITADGANKFFTAEGKAKPLSEVFQVLQDHTKGLTEAQRLAAFKIIFNNRALAAAAILSREGAAGFKTMNAEIGKTTAADVAAKRLDNLSGDVEILKGNIETLLIEAGTPFQNFLRGVVQGATKLLQAFTSLPAPIQETIFVALAITGVLLTLMGTLSIMVGIIFKFAANMLLLKGAIGTVIRILSSLRIAMIATWLAALGPVGLIIAALIAIGIAFVILWKKSETFRDIVKAVGRAVVTAFWAVVHFFQGLPALFGGVWSKITAGATAAKNLLVTIWNTIINFFKSLGSTIAGAVGSMVNAVGNFFAQLPGRTVKFVVAMVNAVIGFIATLPERVAYFIGYMIGRAVKLFIDWNRTVGKIAQNVYTAVVTWLAKLPGRVASFFVSLAKFAVAQFVAFYTTIARVAQNIFNAVINWLKNLPSRVASFFQSMYTQVTGKLRSLQDAAIRLAQNIFNGIVNWLKNLPQNAANFFQNLYNTITSKLQSAVTAAGRLASNIKDAIVNGLRALPGLVRDMINRAIDAVSSAGGAAYEKAKSIGSSLWNGFKDGLGISSPSFIERAMFQIHDTMVNEVDFIKKMVKKAQIEGKAVPNIQKTISGMQGARSMQIIASAGPRTPDDSPKRPPASSGDGRPPPIIQLTTINPVGKTTTEELSDQATRLANLGVL